MFKGDLEDLKMNNGFKITPQPEYEALHTFDAENNVEPARVIAERMAHKFRIPRNHPLVDSISHAIEDAMRLGERRGVHLPERLREG